ncbi:restriction endonuclease subunit S [Streptomyces xanthophaeus]|uniref:restriction endonuclease subunit S n=1 Tax=Streptomyces xanthophaeus TaxID=67385 RepID=UPI00341D2CF5
MRNDETRWVPISELGEVRMGKQLSPAGRGGKFQFPYLRVANVLDGRIDYSDVNSMNFTPAEREIYSLRVGDILLNEGQSLELVGRSALYDGPDGSYCFQNTLIRFRPGGDLFPRYAQAVFSHWLTSGVFARIAKKTTTIAHLGGDRFASLSFPLIPRARQEYLSAALESVSDSIRHVSLEIKKRSAVSSGILEEFFSRFETESFVPLEDVSLVTQGITLGKEVPGGSSVELPYLRVANVQDGLIDTADVKRIRVLVGDVDRYRLREGDLLITEGGDYDKLGRGAVWDGRIDPCLYQNHVFRVRCDSRMDPNFLAAYVASSEGRRYFLSVAKRTTNLASVNSSQVRRMPIPCPEIKQQEEILEVLRAQAMVVRELEQERTKLRQVESGLILDILGE